MQLPWTAITHISWYKVALKEGIYKDNKKTTIILRVIMPSSNCAAHTNHSPPLCRRSHKTTPPFTVTFLRWRNLDNPSTLLRNIKPACGSSPLNDKNLLTSENTRLIPLVIKQTVRNYNNNAWPSITMCGRGFLRDTYCHRVARNRKLRRSYPEPEPRPRTKLNSTQPN